MTAIVVDHIFDSIIVTVDGRCTSDDLVISETTKKYISSDDLGYVVVCGDVSSLTEYVNLYKKHYDIFETRNELVKQMQAGTLELNFEIIHIVNDTVYMLDSYLVDKTTCVDVTMKDLCDLPIFSGSGMVAVQSLYQSIIAPKKNKSTYTFESYKRDIKRIFTDASKVILSMNDNITITVI